MSIRALVAAIAVVAIPIAVSGQQPGETKNRAEKKICTVDNETGSRLGRVRRCMTRREREEFAEEMETDLSASKSIGVDAPNRAMRAVIASRAAMSAAPAADHSTEALVPWEDEYRVIARDGSVRVVHATARPGPIDPVTNTVTWFGVSVDVTAVRDPEHTALGTPHQR